MDQRFKSNFVYNLISELVTLLVPLVTAPYVSRVLLEDGIGKYSFSNAIVLYFIVIASLGFGSYAQRAIALSNVNNEKQSIVFWEIFVARLLTTLFSVFLLLILCLSGIFNYYTKIIIACSANLISVIFNLNFYFQGIEDFKPLCLRNVFIKIIGMILIFLLVRSSKDVWIYALCLNGPILLGNISTWPLLRKKLIKVDLKKINFKRHFLPSLKLFIPSIAIAIYSAIDKTLIGVLSKNPDYDNGCYEQAYRIIVILLTIVTIIGPIMLPRNSKLVLKNELDGFKKNAAFSINFVLFLACLIIPCTIVLSNNLCSWFYGKGYEDVPKMMKILSFVILFMGLSNVFGVQIFLALRKDLMYTLLVSLNVIINIVVSSILIIFFGGVGAAIGTCVAELILVIIEFFLVIHYKVISIKFFILKSFRYFFVGFFTFVICKTLQTMFDYSIISFILIGFISACFYIFLNLITRDKFIYTLFFKSWKK